MAVIDFGPYSPKSSTYKKSKSIVESIDQTAVYNRMVDVEIAGFKGDEIDNFNSIISKYPNLSKEVIAAAVKQGLNGDTPGLGNVASTDALSRLARDSQKLQKLPSVVGSDKNLLAELRDGVWNQAKSTSRYTYAGFRSLYDYLTTIARDASAVLAGEASKGQLLKDLNPISIVAGETSFFGQLNRDIIANNGRDLNSGSGFTISPDSKVGKAQADAMMALGRLGKDSYTIGRGAAVVAFDPGTTPYKVTSGIIDAVLNVASDPTSWLSFSGPAKAVSKVPGGEKLFGLGLTGVAREGKKYAEMQPIAYKEYVEQVVRDVKAPLPSLKKKAKELKTGIVRELDNNFMRAETDSNYAEEALAHAVEFEAKKTNEKVGLALANTSKVLDDANIVRSINEIAIGKDSQAFLMNMGRLSADFSNTKNAFPGALMVEEMPEFGKITYAAQKDAEYAVTLAKKEELNVVDLAKMPLQMTKTEVADYTSKLGQLFDKLVEVSKDTTIPVRTRNALRQVTTPSIIENPVLGTKDLSLAKLMSQVLATKNAGAMGVLSDAIENIWKADAFSNIRSVNGGKGGIAIVNTSKLAAKGVKASDAISTSFSGLYNPVVSVSSSTKFAQEAAMRLEEATKNLQSTQNRIKEIEAIRDYISKDPQLVYKLINNPEYIDIKDIAELEAKIGVKNAIKEGLREEVGLIGSIGGKLNLDIDKVNKFLLGRRFKPIADIISNETSAARILRLFNNKIDAELAGELADATTGDDVLRVLRNHLGDPTQDMNLARSLTLRGESLVNSVPLFKTTLPVYNKALRAMETIETKLSSTRVRSKIVPLDDLDRLVKTTRQWMETIGVKPATVDMAIDKLIKAKAGTDRNVLTVRSKVLEDVVLAAQKEIAEKISPNDKDILAALERVMRLAGKERNFATAYSNALIPTGELPSIFIRKGKAQRMNGALFASQFLDTMARFPDVNSIISLLKRYEASKSVVGKAKALNLYANEAGEIWRTSMLLWRGAYIIRNIGEMQVRQYLSGHETMFANPFGYLAMMYGNPDGNAMQKLLNQFQKYDQDILGNSFLGRDVEESTSLAIQEYKNSLRNGISAGDTRSVDVGVRMFGRSYKTVTSDSPEYYDGLVGNLAAMGVDDFMPLVAKAETDTQKQALVDLLISNKPIKIGKSKRTNLLQDFFNSTREDIDGVLGQSNFAPVFLKNLDEPFSYKNLNREGIYNWLFDLKSTGSYASELAGLMGNGPKGIYIRKLIADGVVDVPMGNGEFRTVKLPKYEDRVTPAEYGKNEKSFKKQLEKAFPREDMPGGRVRAATPIGVHLGSKSTWARVNDSFFGLASKIEDVVNYGPEYRMTYFDYIGKYVGLLSLDDLYRARNAAEKSLYRIKLPSGRQVGKRHQTLRLIDQQILKRKKNPDFLSTATLEQVSNLAAKKAGEYVSGLFYDATQQNNVAAGLRLIWPFVQASANTIKTWAKLGFKNPVQVYKFGKAYDALTKPGSSTLYDITDTQYNENEGFFYKDEYGEMRFRYPLIGGVIGGLMHAAKSFDPRQLQFTSPVQSLNLATGSQNSILPGVGPAGAILYSLSGKSHAFGPAWETLRGFVFPFGEQENKLTIFLPSWLSKIWLATQGDSALIERGVKDWAGVLASSGNYGKNPFISSETRNRLFNDARDLSKWEKAFTGLFQSIAPGTPIVEVLARVPKDKQYGFMAMTQLTQAWVEIQNQNPGDYDGAVRDFVDKFGVNNIMAIISGSTRAVTGTDDAWTFLNKNPKIAEQYAGKSNDVIPYFFPGGEAATSYYNFQKYTQIREKLNPNQLSDAAAELVYNMELSQISSHLYAYNPMWYTEQVIALNNRFGGSKPPTTQTTGRQLDRINAIRKLIESPEMEQSPVYNEAKTFMTQYDAAIRHLQTVRNTAVPDLGGSFWLTARYREDLKDLGRKLVQQNPQFANMYYLVFANSLKENK